MSLGSVVWQGVRELPKERPSPYHGPHRKNASFKERMNVMGLPTGRKGFRFCLSSLSFLFFISLFFSALAIFPAFAAAPPSSGAEAGKIVDARGEAAVKHAGENRWHWAEKGMVLYEGDTLLTGEYGRIYALFSDESLLQLNGGARFAIEQTAKTAGWFSGLGIVDAAKKRLRSVYRLLKGEMWMRNKNRGLVVDIDTPTMVLGVRGTELNAFTDGETTTVLTVLRGNVLATRGAEEVAATAGRQVVSRTGLPLQTSTLLSPEDTVQWTIHVPPGLFAPPSGVSSGPRRSVLEKASSLAAQDKVSEAVKAVEEGLAAYPGDEDLQVYGAALSLKSGRPSEAHDRLGRLASQYPNNASAYRYFSLSALLLDKKEEALQAAERSIALEPSDPQGYILKSYAHQSMFDLSEASDALEKALAIDGTNATALLNLARIRFGSDYPEQAWNLLLQSEAAAPESGRVQELKGFLLLAKQQTDNAMAAFEKALQADSSLGESHLGLALCRMRRAEPEAAMEEMSAAVLLEPRRSLMLSYWAKMLYQLKRFDQALDMLALAKELDPKDPTPYLYEGIIHRDLNRPSEAVESLHAAIALNDNRGVYRSRFLMDQDLAVKNVNLFILYQQLGLSAWAQSKAVSSIKQDFANYAGHLFYGSALVDSGTRTVAGASELLLARILQPANFNAVNSFNSYTPFFDEPAIDGIATAKGGNHKNRGYDIAVFGAIPEHNLAFYADNYYGATDGWRGTNTDRNSGIGALLKYDPTPDDQLSLSYRTLCQKQEDDALGRNMYDQPSNSLDKTDADTDKLEFGYHHHFSPGTDFIFSFTYVKDDAELFEFDRISDVFDIEGVDYYAFSDSEYERPFFQFQAQQTFEAGDHQMLAGALLYAGHTDAENFTEELFVYEDIILDYLASSSDHDPDSRLTSFYVRDIWQLHENWIVEGALYCDRMTQSNPFTGVEWDINELGPRLGVVWKATSSDTVRLAGFKYVLPFTSSRIDPTEIAGVPIFRNTEEGSVAKEVDLVWEHEWDKAFMSLGGFYVDRESTAGFVDAATGEEYEEHYKSRLKGVELACNRILGRGLAVSAGYRFQEVANAFFPDYDRKDHLASAGLNFVHHCGLAAGLAQTWRYEDFDSDAYDNEDIWLTDFAMSYEIPGKTGLIALQVRNIFDNHFNWVEDVFTYQGRVPAREIVGSVSIFF